MTSAGSVFRHAQNSFFITFCADCLDASVGSLALASPSRSQPMVARSTGRMIGGSPNCRGTHAAGTC